MRLTMLPGFMLLLPLAEIASFVIVGKAIGVLATLGLVVLGVVVGMSMLRRHGLGILQRMSAEGRNGVAPGRELLKPAMLVIAGLLFVIPGFISDIIALLICIPAVRDLAWKYVSRRFVVVGRTSGFTASAGSGGDFRPRGPAGGKVVDLDEDDFKRQPDPNSPWSGKRLGD
ncbi:FxsA family protein [Rhizobium sp. BE258]|jgi:UPF0716 protein FxsA|uniref:FxsA family protein n=1 Tax=unclassified Rhizobium TaxID=2613769 RepID=UPI000DD522C0|nr:FxsA family protein [Rhizobium sp. BE258]MDR7145931.1 UPF0716 protein FxsA [Rhizobium sp. BE258]